MVITQLTLNNFRCFEDFDILFSDEYKVHVIIAENMAGKSAIMRALRIAINSYTSGLLTTQGYGIEKYDHRVIGHNVISDISLTSSISIAAKINDREGRPISMQWTKFKDRPSQSRTKTTQPNPANIARSVYEQTILGQCHLPLFNFVGTEYIHVTASETNSFALDGNALQGYRDCLSDKSIKKFLFDWLMRIDGIMAEKERKPSLSQAYGSLPDDALFVFQKAVKSLLPDIISFEWLADKKQPVIGFKNGEMRLFDMLSDGYRYLILLAGELATRAIILNKHLGQNVLAQITGIVLIDEFGIHLHPSLQSEALTRLNQTFPNVQFVISTHSPLLVNGLKKEQVHLLEMDESGKRTVRNPEEDVIGLGAEGILRDLFGLSTTFDKESIKMNERYKSLLSKKRNSALSKSEQKDFENLQRKLSPMRLDPTLEITREDDITRTVRENLDNRSKNLNMNNLKVPENLSQEVDSILNELIKQ